MSIAMARDHWNRGTRWPLVPGRRLLSSSKQLNTNEDSTNVLSLTLRGVVNNDVENPEGQIPSDYATYQMFDAGDLVFKLIDLENIRTSRVGHVHQRGIMSPAYVRLQVGPRLHSRYAYYWYLSLYLRNVFNELGAGIRANLTASQLLDVMVAEPPADEQRRIADFLDDQVARIDNLVQERLRQIQLVEEYAVAQTHELTCGHESMDDWKLGLAFHTGSGTTPHSEKQEYFDGDIPWVCSGDLNDGRLDSSARNVTARALTDYSALKVHPAGSLLVAMYGATVGKTALLRVDACVNQAVCVLRPLGPVDPEFAQYWLIARRSDLLNLASGGGQPNISQDIVRSLRMRVGDASWQRSRVGLIREMREQADLVQNNFRESVDLLGEYKRSLITAAVTGQLDTTTAGRGVSA